MSDHENGNRPESDPHLKALLESLGGAAIRRWNESGGRRALPTCIDCKHNIPMSDAWIYDQPDAGPTPKRCHACREARDSRERLAAATATVPKAYAWARLDAPELSRRVQGVPGREKLEAILGAPRVVFLGAAGAGKTSLAVALFAEAVRREREGRYVAAYRLSIARAQHGLGDGMAPLEAAATTVPLLLLDDLGNERKTELSPVADVIFARHENELVTWVTTPFSLDEIAKRYGDGAARRVFERAEVVELGNKPS